MDEALMVEGNAVGVGVEVGVEEEAALLLMTPVV